MVRERTVAIRTEFIELAALLKWAQVADSGGEAKRLIKDGHVRVNGEIERRRGRKIVSGDRIAIGGEVILVTQPEAQSPKP
jgi:ribosome-associated protein